MHTPFGRVVVVWAASRRERVHLVEEQHTRVCSTSAHEELSHSSLALADVLVQQLWALDRDEVGAGVGRDGFRDERFPAAWWPKQQHTGCRGQTHRRETFWIPDRLGDRELQLCTDLQPREKHSANASVWNIVVDRRYFWLWCLLRGAEYALYIACIYTCLIYHVYPPCMYSEPWMQRTLLYPSKWFVVKDAISLEFVRVVPIATVHCIQGFVVSRVHCIQEYTYLPGCLQWQRAPSQQLWFTNPENEFR